MATSFVVAGDLSSFGATQQEQFRTGLASRYTGVAPADITLTVRAASIIVDAQIAMQNAAAAQQVVIDLTTIPATELSTALGVQVTSVTDTTSSEVMVSVPSPSLPIPPPSAVQTQAPSSPPSSPPPSVALPMAGAASPAASPSLVAGSEAMVGIDAGGTGDSTAVVVAIVAVLLLVLAVGGVLCLRRRRRNAPLRSLKANAADFTSIADVSSTAKSDLPLIGTPSHSDKPGTCQAAFTSSDWRASEPTSSKDVGETCIGDARIDDDEEVGDVRIEGDDDHAASSGVGLRFEDAGLATMTPTAERTTPPGLSSIAVQTPGVDPSPAFQRRLAENVKRMQEGGPTATPGSAAERSQKQKKRMLAVVAAQKLSKDKTSSPNEEQVEVTKATTSLIDGDRAIGMSAVDLAELKKMQMATSANAFIEPGATTPSLALPEASYKPLVTPSPDTSPPKVDGDVPIGMTAEEFQMLMDLRRLAAESDGPHTPKSAASSTADDENERVTTFKAAEYYASREGAPPAHLAQTL